MHHIMNFRLKQVYTTIKSFAAKAIQTLFKLQHYVLCIIISMPPLVTTSYHVPLVCTIDL